MYYISHEINSLLYRGYSFVVRGEQRIQQYGRVFNTRPAELERNALPHIWNDTIRYGLTWIEVLFLSHEELDVKLPIAKCEIDILDLLRTWKRRADKERHVGTC